MKHIKTCQYAYPCGNPVWHDKDQGVFIIKYLEKTAIFSYFTGKFG